MEKGSTNTQNAIEGWQQCYTSTKEQITKLTEDLGQTNQHTQYYRTEADDLKSQIATITVDNLARDDHITTLKNELETT